MLGLLDERAPTLGEGRLLSIDGPAGSGKSTLASEVSRARPARVVAMDDLYEGWGGLPWIGEQLETLLVPLARGLPGHYRRWDWHAGRWAETVEVPPCPLLVLDGVGSGTAAYDALVTVLVWVEASDPLDRALARDGDSMVADLRDWAAAERAHFATDGTRSRADLVLHVP